MRDPLTDEILFGRLEHGGTVTIALEGDALAFRVAPGTLRPEAAAPPTPERV